MNQGYLVRMYFNALKQNLAKKEGMEQTYVVVQSSMLQVLGTRFRAGFVYNMGDEEASKDAGQQATAVYTQSDDDLKLCS